MNRSTRNNRPTAKTRLLAATGLMALLAATQPAFAQTATGQTSPASADPDESTTIEEIVVTASRVVRDGYEAPTPTTVIGIEQIQAAAPATLASFVNQLPALSGSSTPRTTGVGVGGGTGGGNFLNLRNLGANRTLVLLDGRRFAPSTSNGSVDVNLLPSALVSRVDVVTGGASSAWGSDAVAGVVNFVLDTRFAGLKGQVQTGLSGQGDAEENQVELTFGTPFAGGRGHFLASGQITDVASIDRADSRDWYRGYKVVTDPTPTPGEPTRIIAQNVNLATASPGGLVTAGPLRGTQFGVGGVPGPYEFGIVSGLLMIGGEDNDAGRIVQLQTPLDQKTLFTRASFDLTDTLQVFAEASYGLTDVTYISSPYYRLGNITIRNDNPYLDAVTRGRMATAGVTSFTMGRTNLDLGLARPHNEREVMRVVAGANGQFGGDWTWNAYYQHGETDVLNEVLNNAVVSRFNLAVDTVLRPGTSEIVCRSTLTTPGNGCLPLNPFGFGSPSTESIDWINDTASQSIEISQDVASASVQGEPFSTWAGPVSLVAGLEYRKETFSSTADPISIASNFYLGNYKPSSGEYSVSEGFLETVVPLLADSSLGQALDFSGAVRLTDYSTSGQVVTWKAGLSYVPIEGLRLRLTRSRDIRAPNLNDLFLGGQVNTQTVNDPMNGNQTVNILRVTTGNPALKPEIAETIAGGIVYTPSWAPKFTASFDVFDISISDAISVLSQQQIVDRCVAGATDLCGFITRDGAGVITQVVTSGVNVESEKTSGLDMEFSYRTDLADVFAGMDGRLTLRALGTYIQRRTIGEGGTLSDSAGEIPSSLPHWRWVGTATYDQGPFTGNLKVRYVGGGVYDNDWGPLDITDNDIPAVTYVDLSAAYKFDLAGSQAEAYVAVENVLDQDPAVVAGTSGLSYASYGTNPGLYDVVGRMFRVGLRFRR